MVAFHLFFIDFPIEFLPVAFLLILQSRLFDFPKSLAPNLFFLDAFLDQVVFEVVPFCAVALIVLVEFGLVVEEQLIILRLIAKLHFYRINP